MTHNLSGLRIGRTPALVALIAAGALLTNACSAPGATNASSTASAGTSTAAVQTTCGPDPVTMKGYFETGFPLPVRRSRRLPLDRNPHRLDHEEVRSYLPPLPPSHDQYRQPRNPGRATPTRRRTSHPGPTPARQCALVWPESGQGARRPLRRGPTGAGDDRPSQSRLARPNELQPAKRTSPSVILSAARGNGPAAVPRKPSGRPGDH